MTKKDKIDKVINDFSLLPDAKQDYILGVLQALAFAHNQNSQEKQLEIVLSDSGQNMEPA